ncbi:MAG: Cof-type HAD-IIB family hydrolase [Clostridiales bacterium]|nr:Cof-type HAD-IIB family hydrolase [Clostridiales bacterium]
MKLAAIDMDGTLLRTDCTISEYSKNIIEEACQNDIIIVPTSGRSFRNIKMLTKGICGMRYCICGNGSIVADMEEETILFNLKIAPETAFKIYEKVHELEGFVEIYSDTDTYVEKNVAHILYETNIGQYFCDSILSTPVPILSARLLLKRGLMGVNKYHIAFTDPAKTKKMAEFCGQMNDVQITYPSPYNMEVFAKGCNKDSGISMLCNLCDISEEDTIAIGDSNNDIAMIQYAHLGITVENAIPEAKQAANIITKSNDEDGPAIVLKKILNNS